MRKITNSAGFTNATPMTHTSRPSSKSVGVIVDRLDPILLKHDDGRRAMRTKYLGDLFPWTALASSSATGSIYRQFFQKDRDGVPKGIVEIQLQVVQ